MTLRMLSLFSGIGALDLAARWAGVETVAFCEIEPSCQRVLRKNFGQEALIFDDVTKLTAESLRRAGVERVDVVAGGFPCQDISGANPNGKGLDGARSGLWREMFRLVCELRPRFVVVENVPKILDRGVDRVLGDLAGGGYDAEWQVLPASAFGAPHQRERFFLVAFPCGELGERRIFPHSLDDLPRNVEWDSTQNIRSGSGWKRWLIQASQTVDGQGSYSTFFRVDDGTAAEVDAIKALGNTALPQAVYPIFEAIASAEGVR